MRAAPLLTCNSHPALITLACAAQVVSYPSDAPPMAAAVGWAGDLVACCATEAWLALALATLALTAARTVFRARIFLASYTTVAGSAHAGSEVALAVATAVGQAKAVATRGGAPQAHVARDAAP